MGLVIDFLITKAIARPIAPIIPTIISISNKDGNPCARYWKKTPRPAPELSIRPQTPVLSLTGQDIVIFCSFGIFSY